MKKTIIIFAALGIILSACTGAAAPEEEAPVLTGEDIQATAVAMAWTMAAQTQAAMPTATFTPLPPTATFTPAFTPTPIASPTPIFTATPVPTATKESTGISICNWEGEATTLMFINDTKATVGPISVYLSPGSNPKGYGDCFLIVPNLGKFGSASISAPMKGYYFVYAYVDAGNKQFSTQAGFTTNNPDKHEIHFRESDIKVIGP